MSLGLFNLGSATITAAVTDSVLTSSNYNGAAAAYLAGLGGIKSLTAWADFVYGSGGTTAALKIQTSLDQGLNWIDVLRFDFTTANAKKIASVGVFAASAPAAVAALGSEGKLDNILGDRFRALLTTTGTYAGSTTIACRIAAR